MKQKERNQANTNEIADLKNIKVAIEGLPPERLMYIAGAVAALSAASNNPKPTDPPKKDSA